MPSMKANASPGDIHWIPARKPALTVPNIM
jgi:hypothetical protein